MTENIKDVVHLLVRNSIDSVSEMEAQLARALQIVKRAANISCCLCRDECLSCDAHDVLKELGIEK